MSHFNLLEALHNEKKNENYVEYAKLCRKLFSDIDYVQKNMLLTDSLTLINYNGSKKICDKFRLLGYNYLYKLIKTIEDVNVILKFCYHYILTNDLESQHVSLEEKIQAFKLSLKIVYLQVANNQNLTFNLISSIVSLIRLINLEDKQLIYKLDIYQQLSHKHNKKHKLMYSAIAGLCQIISHLQPIYACVGETTFVNTLITTTRKHHKTITLHDFTSQALHCLFNLLIHHSDVFNSIDFYDNCSTNNLTLVDIIISTLCYALNVWSLKANNPLYLSHNLEKECFQISNLQPLLAFFTSGELDTQVEIALQYHNYRRRRRLIREDASPTYRRLDHTLDFDAFSFHSLAYAKDQSEKLETEIELDDNSPLEFIKNLPAFGRVMVYKRALVIMMRYWAGIIVANSTPSPLKDIIKCLTLPFPYTQAAILQMIAETLHIPFPEFHVRIHSFDDLEEWKSSSKNKWLRLQENWKLMNGFTTSELLETFPMGSKCKKKESTFYYQLLLYNMFIRMDLIKTLCEVIKHTRVETILEKYCVQNIVVLASYLLGELLIMGQTIFSTEIAKDNYNLQMPSFLKHEWAEDLKFKSLVMGALAYIDKCEKQASHFKTNPNLANISIVNFFISPFAKLIATDVEAIVINNYIYNNNNDLYINNNYNNNNDDDKIIKDNKDFNYDKNSTNDNDHEEVANLLSTSQLLRKFPKSNLKKRFPFAKPKLSLVFGESAPKKDELYENIVKISPNYPIIHELVHRSNVTFIIERHKGRSNSKMINEKILNLIRSPSLSFAGKRRASVKNVLCQSIDIDESGPRRIHTTPFINMDSLHNEQSQDKLVLDDSKWNWDAILTLFLYISNLQSNTYLYQNPSILTRFLEKLWNFYLPPTERPSARAIKKYHTTGSNKNPMLPYGYRAMKQLNDDNTNVLQIKSFFQSINLFMSFFKNISCRNTSFKMRKNVSFNTRKSPIIDSKRSSAPGFLLKWRRNSVNVLNSLSESNKRELKSPILDDLNIKTLIANKYVTFIIQFLQQISHHLNDVAKSKILPDSMFNPHTIGSLNAQQYFFAVGKILTLYFLDIDSKNSTFVEKNNNRDEEKELEELLCDILSKYEQIIAFNHVPLVKLILSSLSPCLSIHSENFERTKQKKASPSIMDHNGSSLMQKYLNVICKGLHSPNKETSYYALNTVRSIIKLVHLQREHQILQNKYKINNNNDNKNNSENSNNNENNKNPSLTQPLLIDKLITEIFNVFVNISLTDTKEFRIHLNETANFMLLNPQSETDLVLYVAYRTLDDCLHYRSQENTMKMLKLLEKHGYLSQTFNAITSNHNATSKLTDFENYKSSMHITKMQHFLILLLFRCFGCEKAFSYLHNFKHNNNSLVNALVLLWDKVYSFLHIESTERQTFWNCFHYDPLVGHTSNLLTASSSIYQNYHNYYHPNLERTAYVDRDCKEIPNIYRALALHNAGINYLLQKKILQTKKLRYLEDYKPNLSVLTPRYAQNFSDFNKFLLEYKNILLTSAHIISELSRGQFKPLKDMSHIRIIEDFVDFFGREYKLTFVTTNIAIPFKGMAFNCMNMIKTRQINSSSSTFRFTLDSTDYDTIHVIQSWKLLDSNESSRQNSQYIEAPSHMRLNREPIKNLTDIQCLNLILLNEQRNLEATYKIRHIPTLSSNNYSSTRNRRLSLNYPVKIPHILQPNFDDYALELTLKKQNPIYSQGLYSHLKQLTPLIHEKRTCIKCVRQIRQQSEHLPSTLYLSMEITHVYELLTYITALYKRKFARRELNKIKHQNGNLLTDPCLFSEISNFLASTTVSLYVRQLIRHYIGKPDLSFLTGQYM